jgi:hypothetical protein
MRPMGGETLQMRVGIPVVDELLTPFTAVPARDPTGYRNHVAA